MWFIYALITTLAWGTTDLFYKIGAEEEDSHSHLKTAIMVGLVMGTHAFYLLLTKNLNYNFYNIIVYLPVSLMYILSMTVGYYGIRYLEISIASPIQNTSGAIVSILSFIILGQKMTTLSTIGVIIICISVVALGVLEKKKQDEYELKYDKKYKIGFMAFLMPILYCIIDALGTFFDAYYLDDFSKTPLIGTTEETFENIANVSYELTFLIFAIVLLFYLTVVKKEKFVLKQQKSRLFASLFETFGQSTYVFAMSGHGIVAAPMIAAYSIVSVILSRIFIKEKLTKSQYFVVAMVILGIIILGIAEGMS
ncbi:MAG: EamA family transporter [Tissierellia bacterium]|nr:EamA family transporter [Tissierellia bacterium]